MLFTKNEKKLNIGGSMKGTTNLSFEAEIDPSDRLLYCRGRRASGREWCRSRHSIKITAAECTVLATACEPGGDLKPGFALATLATPLALLLRLPSQAGWVERQGARPCLVGTVVADN